MLPNSSHRKKRKRTVDNIVWKSQTAKGGGNAAGDSPFRRKAQAFSGFQPRGTSMTAMSSPPSGRPLQVLNEHDLSRECVALRSWQQMVP